MSLKTVDEIKNGLQEKYPSHNLAAQFEQYVIEEEYSDSDLLRADILDEDEQEILKHLLSANSDIDKDGLNQTLQDIVNGNNNDQDDKEAKNAEPEEEPNNAEPHINDNSMHQSLQQSLQQSNNDNLMHHSCFVSIFITEVTNNDILNINI